MDCRKRQTSTATPAKPGDLPYGLVARWHTATQAVAISPNVRHNPTRPCDPAIYLAQPLPQACHPAGAGADIMNVAATALVSIAPETLLTFICSVG